MNNGMLERSCNPAGIMAYHCAKYEVILVRITCITKVSSKQVFKMFESIEKD
jgi:hypothetical protein